MKTTRQKMKILFSETQKFKEFQRISSSMSFVTLAGNSHMIYGYILIDFKMNIILFDI